MSGPSPVFDRVPEAYEVTVKPIGADCIKVEARLLYRHYGPGLEGQLVPSLSAWIGPHPSLVYVYEPCWLFRLFGDTLDARIERAKRSVTRWAEREVAGERRMFAAAGKAS